VTVTFEAGLIGHLIRQDRRDAPPG
jgi:hypothetical protein